MSDDADRAGICRAPAPPPAASVEPEYSARALAALRVDLADIKCLLAERRALIAAWRLARTRQFYRRALKAGFDPNQPRDELGQWTDAGGGTGATEALSDADPDMSWIPGADYAQLDPGRRYSVNLAEEEARGGHTLRDHVGKSDDELIDVLRRDWERRYGSGVEVTRFRPAQGSFSSITAANDFVNQVLRDNQETVDAVANGRAQATLERRFGFVTGKESFRPTGDADAYIRNTYGVRVLIRNDSGADRGYRVLTAFPVNELIRRR